ncbi:hypothetical protein L218DRAFT_866658, partial [Marasmius fiardii PR-910]
LALSNLIFTSLTTFVPLGVLSTRPSGLLAAGIIYRLLAGGRSGFWSTFVRSITSKDPRPLSRGI